MPGAMQRRVVGHQRAMPPDVPARVRVPTPLASRVVMAGELSRHGQPRPATHDLATVREQPSQLPADRNLRVMAGEGRPPTTLLFATSKDVGGRSEPGLGRAFGPTRGPAMTRRLQRDHLAHLFPDGPQGASASGRPASPWRAQAHER